MERELKHWLAINIYQKSLKVFFEMNKIETIAIYGGGILGNLFYQEVIKYGININYCIDREISQFHKITVVRPTQLDIIKDIDLVIVCVSSGKTDDILSLLHKPGLPSITLMRLLEICYYKEVITPYCKKKGATPYILSWPRYKNLQNLSAFEKVLSEIYMPAERYRANPSYFSNIYGILSEYSDKYIKDVFTLSPTIRKNNTIVHSDITSEYVNIINGLRFTHHVPNIYNNSIYIMGQCVAFGYGIDDSRTIASILQKMICEVHDNHSGYRVVNSGVWGFAINTAYDVTEKLYAMPLKKGDAVVFFNDIFNEQEHQQHISKYFSKVLTHHYYDLFDDFIAAHSSKQLLYFDKAHLSHWGMERVAKSIFNLLKTDIENRSAQSSGKPNISTSEHKVEHQSAEQLPIIVAEEVREVEDTLSSTPNQTLDSFIAFLKLYLRIGENSNGAIVMNCNPFTKGHRHLIETSAEQVDFLYIFVVEEDLSVFPFKDRLELVKLGTEHLKNVIVLPSGKFILSAITFPEYFIKDSIKEVAVDSSKDIEIFAQEIAPILNIRKRFVAQEPFDPITRQYNQTMKDILPIYNIELIEIERYGIEGELISASLVRRLLESNDWAGISKFVPDTTLNYLRIKASNASDK